MVIMEAAGFPFGTASRRSFILFIINYKSKSGLNRAGTDKVK